MEKTHYCINCGKNINHKDLVVTTSFEELPVKGEPITVGVKISRCPYCGNEIFDIESDSESLVHAFEIYCAKHNLLTRKPIKGLREYLGLTIDEFASLSGIDASCIKKYENGSIIKEDHDAIYRVIMRFSGYDTEGVNPSIVIKSLFSSINNVKNSMITAVRAECVKLKVIDLPYDELYKFPDKYKKSIIDNGVHICEFLHDPDKDIVQYACDYLLKKHNRNRPIDMTFDMPNLTKLIKDSCSCYCASSSEIEINFYNGVYATIGKETEDYFSFNIAGSIDDRILSKKFPKNVICGLVVFHTENELIEAVKVAKSLKPRRSLYVNGNC